MGASRRELPRWLWLWVPVLFFAVQWPLRAVGWLEYRLWMGTEAGPIENLTFLACVVGVGAGVLVLAQSKLPRHARAWVALITLGCLYFGGEEISWGQHLHNLAGIGPLLDQVPRLLLIVGAFIGGIVAPLSRRRRGAPDGWFWPTLACTPVAVIAVFMRTPHWIQGGEVDEMQPEWLRIHYGETEELYLAAFLMMCLLSLRKRYASAHAEVHCGPPTSRERATSSGVRSAAS